jgi:UDP-3-O-[3-hydroxymyristoyl] glucosamine N-acyltransferase
MGSIMPHRTLSELAEICGAACEGDGSRVIRGPAALLDAASDQISFFGHERYQRELEATRAGALVVPLDIAVSRRDVALLRCADANASFAAIVRSFGLVPAKPAPGVHPTAVVHSSAKLGRGVAIGAHCVIGAEVSLGDDVALHPHVVVGNRVSIGAHTEINPQVTLYDGVSIGARCIVHAGAVIGADGFGFDPVVGQAGFERWDKVPQCGTVVIEDEVEIGANCTIDRGRFAATRIGRGSKLDNLVHVAHNVQLDEHVLLIAQVGIAGSSNIGRGAVIAGQGGVAPQVEVGAGARVAAASAVFESVPAGADYMGYWAQPRREWMRTRARLDKLGDLVARVKRLEGELARLQERAR